MRKHWIDNLRWVTVALVLIYHVFYFYNNKGVFGGVGGFSDDPMAQPQDVVMYVLYPWFMMLLFLIAGISARYAIDKPGFVRARTLKLLVPSTVGLLVFHWITGYVNTIVPAQMGVLPGGIFRYFISVVSGVGPLWFIQDLWVFSLLLVLIRKLDAADKFYDWCGKASAPVVVLLGVIVYLCAQLLPGGTDWQSASSLLVLYRPVTYFAVFLMGYFVFSHDEVQARVKSITIPMIVAALVSGIAFIVTTYPKPQTSPAVLKSWLEILYAWTMILALTGAFMKWFDKTDRFAGYMTRSSFGLYIVHYEILAVVGWLLKNDTTLPPVAIYILLSLAVLGLSPVLYEILKRIPIVRWCVFGIKK